MDIVSDAALSNARNARYQSELVNAENAIIVTKYSSKFHSDFSFLADKGHEIYESGDRHDAIFYQGMAGQVRRVYDRRGSGAMDLPQPGGGPSRLP